MKVLILGSGVIGVTTAYVLASRGHSVEVIDRQNESGMECSYANGGQLSYSHGEPWATPSVLRKLPKWMLHKDSPLIFRPRIDMDMYLWGLKFLRNCTTQRSEINGMNMLRLGLYSRTMMQQIMDETQVAFDYAPTGLLQIVGTEKELEAAKKQMDFQAKFGCEQHVFSRDDVLNFEPTLNHTQMPIVGGIFSPQDASADIHPFTTGLARICAERLGVKFYYDTEVKSIEADNNRITAVNSSLGVHTADAYVMAMGAYSPLFTRGLGVRIPVYPMKGYSITFPVDENTPKVSVTDSYHKVVFTRLGDRLRVAGTAELAGYDHEIREDRIDPIIRAARRLFPYTDWDHPLEKWACLRPSTPSSLPVMGASALENLYLNTGHGTLGWTQAAGSAYIVADIMEKRTPAISLGGLTLAGV